MSTREGWAQVSTAKLTEKQVREIRARFRHRNGQLLAKEYNVARTTISSIISGKSWAWVK